MGKSTNIGVDGIQQCLVQYASGLSYQSLTREASHQAKVRVIDTLSALAAGIFGEPCKIARDLAAQMPNPAGASVIGTRLKTSPDLAAFVNATTARYPELTDTYHWPGSFGGHPSDVVMPVLAAAEYARASGREFITAIVLAYEIFLRLSDKFKNYGWDPVNFGCIGVAAASGKLFGLSAGQLSHAISMAAVSSNVLRQVRTGHLSMYKAAAAGHAGRSAVFAALLARLGMEGPHLPFEGKAGWCDHVARERFTLDAMGGNGISFKISDSQMKSHPCNGVTIAPILAAERVAPLSNYKKVERVVVEVYKKAKDHAGTGEQRWDPHTKETADHSIPYVIAATLLDGTVTPRSYDDAHLWNPDLRSLMKKIEVVEDADFTRAYERIPQWHFARVIVSMEDGTKTIGETGGDQDDLAIPKSDAQVERKFLSVTHDVLGTQRSRKILESLWTMEDMPNLDEMVRAFEFA